MTKRRYFVILNPVAGNGKSIHKLEMVKEEFRLRDICFDLYCTDVHTRADELIRKKFDRSIYSDILILGGDGTINETANGLDDRNVPVSVISMGTGNDTIKHIHQSLDFNYQLKTAFEGQVTPVDAGVCNGRLFLNGIGLGFDGKVVEIMAKEGKKYAGHSAYLSVVLRILITFREKEVAVRLDDQDFRKEILLMTIAKGTTFGGGFLINPYSVNNDGLLDICVFKKTPLWMRILYLPKMKSGGHKNLKVVSFYKSKTVNIEENRDLVAHMDGEFIGHPPFTISVIPRAFSFRV